MVFPFHPIGDYFFLKLGMPEKSKITCFYSKELLQVTILTRKFLLSLLILIVGRHDFYSGLVGPFQLAIAEFDQ